MNITKKQRTKLLFEYMKEYGRFENLFEAVIHVDKYLNVIEDVFLSNRKKITSIADKNKIKLLNDLFYSFKISFELINEPVSNYGVVRAVNSKEHIKVFLNHEVFTFMIDSFYREWLKTLLPLIGHELVHRGQFFIRKNDFVNFYGFENNGKLSIDTIEATNTQEIMAYALMGIENLRFKGFSDEQILNKVKNYNEKEMESGIMILYLSDMKKYNFEVYKKFCKYVYGYLKNPIVYDLKILI